MLLLVMVFQSHERKTRLILSKSTEQKILVLFCGCYSDKGTRIHLKLLVFFFQ